MMFIPGRIEVLGKHTDYCGGRSIVCAIDRGFYADVESRTDSIVELADLASSEQVSFDLASPADRVDGHWINYAAAVGRRLSQNVTERPLTGATIRFRSDLPQAAGLSSSSALMIMVFAALSASNELPKSAEFTENITNATELAEYLGCIENGQSFRGLTGSAGVGTFGGSQDHAAITLGEADRLSRFSFAPLAREATFEFPADYIFVVASSGVAAEKTGGARDRYNRVSMLAAEITKAVDRGGSLARSIEEIGIDAVRDAVLRSDLAFTTTELLQRLEHFRVENIEIIPAVSELLAEGRIDAIGELVDRSQENAERLLGNQTEETIFLQRTARDIGVVAASAFGAGFGGSVYSIVPTGDAQDVLIEWRSKYVKKFPRRAESCEFFLARPSECRLS